MGRDKSSLDYHSIVAHLAQMERVARRALNGNSNDAEHDALYEIRAMLEALTRDVRRTRKDLKRA